MTIAGKVLIAEKEYSVDTLKIITGHSVLKDLDSISEELLLLCSVIDNPYLLPYFLETFYSMQLRDENLFHFALLRVQVDSQLRMNEDIQKHQHRIYVARTLEKLLFNELLLEMVSVQEIVE
ncbi:MAG: hypothetical protein ACC612_11545 [Methanomethylovorans sp.]|uniref:hypothetical protein n=1 Tax=Methanomethylovorans sp. TaxID=2758717 RepID=UPI003530F2D9